MSAPVASCGPYVCDFPHIYHYGMEDWEKRWTCPNCKTRYVLQQQGWFSKIVQGIRLHLGLDAWSAPDGHWVTEDRP